MTNEELLSQVLRLTESLRTLEKRVGYLESLIEEEEIEAEPVGQYLNGRG